MLAANVVKIFPKFQSPPTSRAATAVLRRFLYKDNFAEAVKRFKFHNRAQYAKALAFAIITALGSAGTDLDFDYITCVPMHKEQKLNRGYNQSELLAKECADLMRTKYIHSLEKYKKNQVQHTLSGAERRKEC